MFLLPDDFIQRITGVYGYSGSAWLKRLPDLIDEYCQHWSLEMEPPYEPLTYSYTAPGILSDGSKVVLKLAVPNRELSTECEALRIFAGHGSVRLLEAAPEQGVLLLERIIPGGVLMNFDDDERATAIAIEVMQSLWKPISDDHNFPTTADWGKGFKRLRNHFDGGTGAFPDYLVRKAEETFSELVHPKGVIGEPAYETGAFLRNPFPDLLDNVDIVQILERRVDQFSQGLGFDQERILGWAFSQAVLSAWWSYEDNEQDWREMLAVAEIFHDIG